MKLYLGAAHLCSPLLHSYTFTEFVYMDKYYLYELI